MAETTKVGGKELTWDQIVKKMGIDKARVAAPELDPKYQEMVKAEGQAEGSADYSHQYIDPSTVTAKGWAGLGSPQEIMQGIKGEEGVKNPKLERLLGAVGQDIMQPVSGGENPIADVIGNKPVETAAQGAAKPKDPTKGGTTTTPAQTFANNEDQLFNSLINQYQAEMNVVNPYISGANSGQYANMATQIGQSFAGGGVQAANPQTAGILSKDAQAYAAANQAGVQGITSALKGAGTANAQYLQASPYLSILNALQSEAQYKTETGAGTPGLASSQLPAWLNYASQSAGTGTAPGTSTVGTGTGSAPNVSQPNVSTPTTDTTTPSGQP
jgi:hypothetical protein